MSHWHGNAMNVRWFLTLSCNWHAGCLTYLKLKAVTGQCSTAPELIKTENDNSRGRHYAKDSNEQGTAGFYSDRTDDRCGDYWYFGGDCYSAISELYCPRSSQRSCLIVRCC